MLLKRLTMVLLGMGLLVSTLARAELPAGYKVTLLTENAPPFSMAEDGKNFAREESLRGIAVELVREMFQKAGIPYSMTLRFPWARVQKMALESPNHGAFLAAQINQHEYMFKWVGPIATDDWVLLSKADNNISLESLGQASGYRVGVGKGSEIEAHLLDQGLRPVAVAADQENASKLRNGQIDLWATRAPAGTYLARQQGVTGLKPVLRIQSTPLFLALNPETPDEVVERLQKAFDELKASGRVEQIFQSYLQ